MPNLSITICKGLSATRPQSISILTEKEGFEHVLFTERFHDWGDDVSNSVLAVRQATNVLAKDKTRYVYDRGGRKFFISLNILFDGNANG